jgi:hypothetical protein
VAACNTGHTRKCAVHDNECTPLHTTAVVERRIWTYLDIRRNGGAVFSSEQECQQDPKAVHVRHLGYLPSENMEGKQLPILNLGAPY